MTDLFQFTFDAMASSILLCIFLREFMIFFLPDHLAGPGGSLINTDPRG